MISLQVMTPRRVLWEGKVSSVQLPGDRGDFEVFPFHKPVVGALRRGDIVFDDDKGGHKALYIRSGIIRFDNNSMVALVELENK